MTLGKHFINDVGAVVERGLRSHLTNDGRLRLIESEKVLYLQPSSSNEKVHLISGGGSGHEPAHAGYVGDGMLDICVAGNVFASPSAPQILAGLRSCPSKKGTLMIVKNYTGDKLNFGLAAEKAKAGGQKVNVIVVGDDVAVEGNTLVGRRGLAGVTFVHKIAGAAAAEGKSLEEVTKIAQRVADSLVTAAVSLDRCSVPSRIEQSSLPQTELEFGMGIHNEPGVKRTAIPQLQETINALLDMLLKKKNFWTPESGSRVSAMVNNLGGLSVLELSVVSEEAMKQLAERGLVIRRIFTGPFVTSLDAPGFSITLLGVDDELERLLDAPTSAPAWPKKSGVPSDLKTQVVECHTLGHDEISQNGGPESVSDIRLTFAVSSTVATEIIESIATSVKRDEPTITRYDTIAGDGDCGETLLAGADSLKSSILPLRDEGVSLSVLFQKIAAAVETSMGGTSGAIYAIFLNAVSNAVASSSTSPAATLPQALRAGLDELCKYTAARKGHRTLMDALIPFVDTLEQTTDFNHACDAAQSGAESTKNLDALLGRASYVDKGVFEKEGGIPDPGALGVVSVLRGIQKGLKNG
ncbi:dihydroxyacetone kinase [Eremomyces bilateralis CBS 781.70]|uniref:Dihydroxyacetone kinase n=1 Tax=Eremomyces bilateralis CBS 781.70 TaxID=1392243 RepID=A0A6G1FQ53_9PEZI|nr:dihydroxyacetone kinase [Eremomyces bilateralis CBS 781.70]KAF1807934.1 dihydroxyacetone kinase [Eremomyces bilateralis CBS 781.70]